MLSFDKHSQRYHMTNPANVSKAHNATAIEQPAPNGLFLELGERFEEWLRLLQNAHGNLVMNTSPTCEGESPTASIYVESTGGSDCQVIFEGVLQVEGHLAGNIRSSNGTLVMPEQVKIEADIEVGVALINGRVNGNIKASQRVVLQSHARVEGNISTPSLSINDGAIFEGECVFLEDEAAPAIRSNEIMRSFAKQAS